jgi:catecholate siderophore receptor
MRHRSLKWINANENDSHYTAADNDQPRSGSMKKNAHLSPLCAALLAASATPSAWSQAAANAAPDVQAAAGAAIPADAAAVVAGGLQRVTVEGATPDGFGGSVTSLAKLPADLKDVPQSVTVLSKALLQSQGAASLADALRNVPGITLGGAEGGQIGNNINLNGFTARTDIYLDGFRDRGQYYRDTFALEAVEVLMGPSSMLFGRGSTGGVIDQVGKVPQRKGLTELSGSVTTNGMVRATVDHDRPVGETAAIRIAAMAQEGAPGTRDAMKNRDAGVAPSLRLGIGTLTEITLSALLQRNHDMPDYGVPPLNGRPAPVDRDAFYGFADDRTDQEIASFGALVVQRLGAGTVLRDKLQSNHVHVDARETAAQGLGTVDATGYTPLPAGPYTGPLDALYVRLQGHDRVIDDHSVYNQADLSTQLDTGAVHHELLAGAEIGHDTYANQASYRSGSCNGVALGGTSGYVGCEKLTAPVRADSPTQVQNLGNLSTGSANAYGLYLGDTAALGAQVKLVGGLRRDWFQARIANTTSSPKTIAQDVASTSYRAGAIWQPAPAQSYYASYSTSFNPSLEQLTNTTGTTAPLPPARNKAWEGGAKLDLLDGRLSLDAAAFQITQLGARSQNPDGSYAATGTVRVRGVRAGASGQPAKGLKVFAGAAWLDARIVDAIAVGTEGKVPANTPRGSATLWTTCAFMPHWEAGGGAIYQSARWMNNTDTTRVGGYARLDATLAYRRHDYDLRLNVFNLGDRRYSDALIPSDGGRAVPGSGRTAMLSFDYRI